MTLLRSFASPHTHTTHTRNHTSFYYTCILKSIFLLYCRVGNWLFSILPIGLFLCSIFLVWTRLDFVHNQKKKKESSILFTSASTFIKKRIRLKEYRLVNIVAYRGGLRFSWIAVLSRQFSICKGANNTLHESLSASALLEENRVWEDLLW